MPRTSKREDQSRNERDLADRDPVEVLRRILAISPEDAEKVREDAAQAVKPETDHGNT